MTTPINPVLDPTNPTVDISTLTSFGKVRTKRDFSEDVREQAPVAQELTESGRLKDAVELLLGLEKKCRLAGDTHSAGETALLILKLCRKANDWAELNANIVLLFKRRSQFKIVQEKIVQEAAEFVPDAPDRKTELELIATLRSVAEGKLFLEVERARLTRRLAQIKEIDEKDVSAAADILQEEQVETYGAMDKREKYDYLLEQIRLVLAKRDFVRAMILTRKVQKKILDEPALEDLKVRYHRLALQLSEHDRDALEMSHSHLAIYSCSSIKADPALWIPEISAACLCLALAPLESHQDSQIRLVLANPELVKIPFFYRKLLERLVTNELSPWPLPESQDMPKEVIHRLLLDPAWVETLRERVIEHNVRVVAGCYTKIHTKRLAGFLGLSEDDTEGHISRMVTTTSQQPLFAKIDRPAGVVVFAKRKDANLHLNEVRSDVSSLLDLVENTVHLIHKENMMHGVGAVAVQAE